MQHQINDMFWLINDDSNYDISIIIWIKFKNKD